MPASPAALASPVVKAYCIHVMQDTQTSSKRSEMCRERQSVLMLNAAGGSGERRLLFWLGSAHEGQQGKWGHSIYVLWENSRRADSVLQATNYRKRLCCSTGTWFSCSSGLITPTAYPYKNIQYTCSQRFSTQWLPASEKLTDFENEVVIYVDDVCLQVFFHCL